MFKKICSLFLVLTLITVSFIGCGSKPAATENSGDENLKVALILPGTVNDASWSALALEGINLLSEDFDATVKYNESVGPSDAEQIFRGYANQGYDCILGHGYEFSDAAEVVAAEYPDSYFWISNGSKVIEPNLSAMKIDSVEFGFALGAVSAILSENQNIGIVQGTEAPPMRDTEKGYVAGAKYINPDIEAHVIYSGTLDDAAKVKETAISLIQGGADVITQNADHASLGAITACEEKNVMNIGAMGDQSAVGPNTVVVNMMQDIVQMIYSAGEIVAKDEFKPENHAFGIKEGTIYLSEYTDAFSDVITEEKKQQTQQLMEDLKSGKIDMEAEIAKYSAS